VTGISLVSAQPSELYEERIETRIGADEVPLDSAQGPPLAHASPHHDAHAQTAEAGEPSVSRMG
jgi:hypothetical protein